MIHSELGKVIMEIPDDKTLAEGVVYSDLACIFDAITKNFSLDTLINYIGIYKGDTRW